MRKLGGASRREAGTKPPQIWRLFWFFFGVFVYNGKMTSAFYAVRGLARAALLWATGLFAAGVAGGGGGNVAIAAALFFDLEG